MPEQEQRGQQQGRKNTDELRNMPRGDEPNREISGQGKGENMGNEDREMQDRSREQGGRRMQGNSGQENSESDQEKE